MDCKVLTLAELAAATHSKLIGNPNHRIHGVADLDSASLSDASFLANPRYMQAMEKSNAGVVFVSPTTTLIANRNFLVNENPSQAFQTTIDLFYENAMEHSGFTGIHPTAVIHPTAKINPNVTICPHAVIDKNVTIGTGSFIGSGCYIGPGTTIGTDCILHPHVTVRERCTIGNRVILQPGVVIGSCGFGYLTSAQGKHTKLNQVGNVTIADDVEIGANTTIDRARFKTTHVGPGTKLDNLIQIAHGVELGPDNIIAAQTGIAGSTKTGRCFMSGGQVAITGHIEIADGVMVAAKSGVTKSLTQSGKYNGVPAQPIQKYNRNTVMLRNIQTYVDQIKELQKRITLLEGTK
ncbi:MAG: UDP-3-O-(3-hydroxymyristoyl)glucosamine N-acyltransferase [Parachlamydiaceae bacterium]|nr:UDP-3-O-(3-hydroxymyristoyl)glucosamine N-acyltransferase [Parachlamydiaceae bacterium]